MRSRNVQRGARIALQDPGLHAIGGRRDAGGPLDRIPYVQHVREVWIADTGHGGQDPLAVLRDHVQQQLLIGQLIFTSLDTGKAVLERTGTTAQPKRATTHAGAERLRRVNLIERQRDQSESEAVSDARA